MIFDELRGRAHRGRRGELEKVSQENPEPGQAGAQNIERSRSDISEHVSCQEYQIGENEENKAAVQWRRGDMNPVNQASEDSE